MIKEIKRIRITKDFIEFLGLLRRHHIDDLNGTGYYNSDGSNVMFVYHNHKIIRIDTYYFPDCVLPVDKFIISIIKHFTKCSNYRITYG